MGKGILKKFEILAEDSIKKQEKQEYIGAIMFGILIIGLGLTPVFELRGSFLVGGIVFILPGIGFLIRDFLCAKQPKFKNTGT